MSILKADFVCSRNVALVVRMCGHIGTLYSAFFVKIMVFLLTQIWLAVFMLYQWLYSDLYIIIIEPFVLNIVIFCCYCANETVLGDYIPFFLPGYINYIFRYFNQLHLKLFLLDTNFQSWFVLRSVHILTLHLFHLYCLISDTNNPIL